VIGGIGSNLLPFIISSRLIIIGFFKTVYIPTLENGRNLMCVGFSVFSMAMRLKKSGEVFDIIHWRIEG
jgi:hypothetical protein